MTNSSANLISENNFDAVNFINEYDYWIFDLDNTIYDFHLGLFRRISQRMTEYIKNLLNINHDEALSLQKNMYKKYGLTLRGLIIEKNIDPEPFLNYLDEKFSKLQRIGTTLGFAGANIIIISDIHLYGL